jgi:hypothetical protein
VSGVHLVAIGVVIGNLSGAFARAGLRSDNRGHPFFAAVNLIGLDIIGAYVRRAFNEQEMVGSARCS